MFRTKRQRSVLCSTCPFAKTANLIGDSVVLLIIRELLKSPHRFGELEEVLPGVSTRTLTDKLELLVREGVLVRHEFIGKPPKVEYSLTKKGEGLDDVAKAMVSYGKKYLQGAAH